MPAKGSAGGASPAKQLAQNQNNGTMVSHRVTLKQRRKSWKLVIRDREHIICVYIRMYFDLQKAFLLCHAAFICIDGCFYSVICS